MASDDLTNARALAAGASASSVELLRAILQVSLATHDRAAGADSAPAAAVPDEPKPKAKRAARGRKPRTTKAD